MSLVTPAQLEAVRSVANLGLDTIADAILRSVQVESDFGSEDAWATVALDVPCWNRAAGMGKLALANNAIALTGVFRCHFEVGVDIQPNDQVVIDGLTYTVTDTNSENTLQVFSTAIMRRVE